MPCSSVVEAQREYSQARDYAILVGCPGHASFVVDFDFDFDFDA